MRIVIEVEGAEISIIAKEIGTKDSPQDTRLRQSGENILDAGTAPSFDQLSISNPEGSQKNIPEQVASTGENAGQAPNMLLASAIPNSVTSDVSESESMDSDVIDAGASKFTPPKTKTSTSRQ